MVSRVWVFTLNNPTPDDFNTLDVLFADPTVLDLVVGLEVGEGGTEHFQGFIKFASPKRLRAVSGLLSRAHIEICKDGSIGHQRAKARITEHYRFLIPF